MIRAVIFDLDGTLVDTSEGYLLAYNEALKTMGFRTVSRSEFGKYYGQRDLEIFRQILKKPTVDDTVEELAKVKRRIFEKIGNSYVKALPSAAELINAFSERKVPIAVASVARITAIQTALQKIGVKNDIKTIVSGDDIQNSKPHPEIFLKAAKKLKIEPKDCLVFEDSPWGVMAAKAAGMKCIAVATGTTSKKDLKKLAPDRVIGSMKEILSEIDDVLASI